MLKRSGALAKSLLILFFTLTLLCTHAYGEGETGGEEDAETYRNLKIFADVIEEIENNYVEPVDTAGLVEKAIQGMVRSLDPHSAFLSEEDYQSLQDDTRGEFSGIGIVLSIKNNMLTVISPIEDSPAQKAGIKAGDVIIEVDGVSTQDMTINEAVNKIKGPQGTELTITIVRKESDPPITMTLRRAEIPLESVKSAPLKPGYIYMALTNFNENTERDLEKALASLESGKEKIKGLVLDLRGNPGGLLQQAVMVSDLFIKEGVIVSIKGRHESQNQVWYATKSPADRSYPMVVLINEGSASASEIVAGALQDHGRALILGTTSFGKGSVQNVKPLMNGKALKLTVARYYTPKGRSIQALGIEPDIDLPYRKESPETAVKKRASFKERDLKNHLKATEKTEPNGDGEDEMLMQDNQVRRALELLVGHHLFKRNG